MCSSVAVLLTAHVQLLASVALLATLGASVLSANIGRSPDEDKRLAAPSVLH